MGPTIGQCVGKGLRLINVVMVDWVVRGRGFVVGGITSVFIKLFINVNHRLTCKGPQFKILCLF